LTGGREGGERGGGEGGGEWGRADKYGNTITNNNTIIRQEKNKFLQGQNMVH
jgi:hypothetical protein